MRPILTESVRIWSTYEEKNAALIQYVREATELTIYLIQQEWSYSFQYIAFQHTQITPLDMEGTVLIA